jgi:hypothetical protein
MDHTFHYDPDSVTSWGAYDRRSAMPRNNNITGPLLHTSHSARTSNMSDLVQMLNEKSVAEENRRYRDCMLDNPFSDQNFTSVDEIEHYYRLIAIHQTWFIDTPTENEHYMTLSEEKIAWYKHIIENLHIRREAEYHAGVARWNLKYPNGYRDEEDLRNNPPVWRVMQSE